MAESLPKKAIEVPRVDFSNGSIKEYFAKGEPVVIVNSSLVKSAAGKWSPDYLKEYINKDAKCTVFESPDYNFRYWDPDKNAGEFDWKPPNRKLELPYTEFLALARGQLSRPSSERGKENPEKDVKTEPKRHYYLQQKLTTNEATEQLLKDFSAFDWTKVVEIKLVNSWGPLTHNLLLVGEEKNCTPAHYDEQENIFCQLWGKKKIVLYSPEDWTKLYTFPTHHTCDRQSQIDFDHIDYKKYPNFLQAQAYETVLSPGEALFIPSYWFHHITACSENVSVNFWFKAYNPPPEKITFPLKPSQWVALTRNFEKFLGSLVKERNVDDALLRLIKNDKPDEETKSLRQQVDTLLGHVMKKEDIAPFLHEITTGRYGVLAKLPPSTSPTPQPISPLLSALPALSISPSDPSAPPSVPRETKEEKALQIDSASKSSTQAKKKKKKKKKKKAKGT